MNAEPIGSHSQSALSTGKEMNEQTTTTTTTPLLVRVEEAARMLSLGRSTVYELIASGQLPSITIGKSRRVPVEALKQWIVEHIEVGYAT